MNQTTESHIREAEHRLRDAMLNSDVDALDRLLAPELIFTNHLGQLQGKQDDLAAYRSGALKIKSLIPSEQRIHVYGDIGIVSVRVQLLGTYAGNSANGDFRFTRVWAFSGDKVWRVVAAHAGVVA
jgi:ketosteroid isomerase-like protein